MTYLTRILITTLRLQLVIILTLLSCTSRESGEASESDVEESTVEVPSEWKMLDFKNFTIQVPPTWQPVRLRGIDSFVGLIALDKGDTISFDFGWYSNSLDEESIFVDGKNNLYLVDEKSELTFYGKADTVDVEKFKINKIRWTKIDGKRAKIVQPKQTGTGMTGVYFDSLWADGPGTNRLEMNGKDLEPENERLLLQVFETLKFKK